MTEKKGCTWETRLAAQSYRNSSRRPEMPPSAPTLRKPRSLTPGPAFPTIGTMPDLIDSLGLTSVWTTSGYS